MSSYQLSSRINVQTILFWGVARPLYQGATAIDKGCAAIGQAYRLFCSYLPTLLFAVGLLVKALTLTACVVGAAFLALTFWVVLAKLAVGLLIVAAFGWATYPRKAVRK